MNTDHPFSMECLTLASVLLLSGLPFLFHLKVSILGQSPEFFQFKEGTTTYPETPGRKPERPPRSLASLQACRRCLLNTLLPPACPPALSPTWVTSTVPSSPCRASQYPHSPLQSTGFPPKSRRLLLEILPGFSSGQSPQLSLASKSCALFLLLSCSSLQQPALRPS